MLNDPYYGERPVGENALEYWPLPEYESKMHDPVTKASYQEMAENELMWIKRKTGQKS